MRKGQSSVEAVSVLGLAMTTFAVIVSISLWLGEDSSQRNILLTRNIACQAISTAIDGVYAEGGGARTTIDVSEEVAIRPGIVVLSDGFYCTISPTSVSGAYSLHPGAHIILNRGGQVEFI